MLNEKYKRLCSLHYSRPNFNHELDFADLYTCSFSYNSYVQLKCNDHYLPNLSLNLELDFENHYTHTHTHQLHAAKRTCNLLVLAIY